MGFIDSVSAAFRHRGTIAGGMHLQKRFGETKRRRAWVVSQQTAARRQGHRDQKDTSCRGCRRFSFSANNSIAIYNNSSTRLQTEQKSPTWNVLGAHFSLLFLSVISAKLHLLWLWTVVSISTSVCVCSQHLFVKKLKGSEYTLVQSRSSNVRHFFAISFKTKKVITLFRHHGWLFVTLGSLIYFKKCYLHSFSNWKSVFL